MGKVWAYFLKKLGSTDWSMRILERLDFWSDMMQSIQILGFLIILKVFRFAFIQADIFFFKLYNILTKIDISCVKS